MASIASTSTVTESTASISNSRPQAGPLPVKQGEIGYREDLHGRDLERGVEEVSRSPLPERHPADRDAPPTNVPPTPAAGAVSASQTAGGSRDSSSTHPTNKKSIKKIPTVAGVRLTTLLLFITQVLLIGGTIAGWTLAVLRITKNSAKSNASGASGGATIYIHVVFAVVVLAQLLLLERRIFRIRAERYTHLHPGEVLSTSETPSNVNMGIAPWLRPPLPTYAAALAQSGRGTGDVEDHIILAPPPPAYGQTRNSRLLLTGYLRNSLRAQRPVSEHSQMSQQAAGRHGPDGERPLSYVSHDEQWQEIQDAERARNLEDALINLEEAGGMSNSVAQR